MKLAVLHLSDLHVRHATDEILQRSRPIVGALSSLDAAPDGVLVVLSGDVAFSGAVDEYALAIKFLDALRGALSEWDSSVQVKFAIVPGNHDCNHGDNSEVRQMLRESAGPKLKELTATSESIEKLLSVQQNFLAFTKRILNLDAGPESRLCHTEILQFGDTKIQLHTYNTALFSAKHEVQGSLYVPTELAASSIGLDASAALSISVFHHPYNWLESNNSQAFKALVESTSDLILTGHQHVESSFSKRVRTGETTLYFEGAALYEAETRTSAFSGFLFDLGENRYKHGHFVWSGSLYIPDSTVEWQKLERNEKIRHSFRNTPEFTPWLQDVGTGFSHPRVSLRLSDIFVYPSLKNTGIALKGEKQRIASEEVVNFFREHEAAIVLGPSQSGKTSLARMLYVDLQPATVPIFCTGLEFGSAGEEQVLTQCWRAFKRQYPPELLTAFQQLGKKSRTLIIDDWNKSKLNPNGQGKVIRALQKHFGRIILFADELYQVRELTLDKDEKKQSLKIEHLAITPLGHALRGRLIEKWHSLGREFTYNEDHFHREVDESVRTLQSVIRRNVIQSYPMVILAVMQASQQSGGGSTPQYGSYGYIFEMLMTAALAKVSRDITDVDTLYTVLSRVGYFIFENGLEAISKAQFQQVLDEYWQIYRIPIAADRLLRDLVQQRVFIEGSGMYSFRYNHFYLYFVARYFSEALRANDAQARTKLYAMTDRLASEDYSSILMIVLYLTRDPALIDHIVSFADRIYAQLQPCDLSKDVEFINSIFEEEPLKIEAVNISENRQRQRELQDEAESDVDVDSKEAGISYADELPEVLKLGFASKALELLGQVVRNFPGSLTGEVKTKIVESEYSLGLRILQAVLRLLRESFGQLQEVLLESLREESGGSELLERELHEIIDSLLAILSRVLAFTVIKQISKCVGLEKLAGIYNGVVEKLEPQSSVRAVDLAIRLDHFVHFPEAEVAQLHRYYIGNPFARQIVADLVAHHLILVPTDYRIRQRVCSLLGIQMTNVLMLASPDKLVSGPE